MFTSFLAFLASSQKNLKFKNFFLTRSTFNASFSKSLINFFYRFNVDVVFSKKIQNIKNIINRQ
jgi:hypothetical protein